MSAKYDAFMAELQQLCEKHDVAIYPELYEAIDVWDASSSDTPFSEWLFRDQTIAEPVP